MNKKIISFTLGAAMLISPFVGFAQTSTSEQIQILLAQIAALQAQVNILQGQTPSTGVVQCEFERNMFLGVTGEDVRCLQRYLNSAGFRLRTDAGPGSPGLETNFYGNLTKSAVMRWQAANGVSPAVGFFGPISRAKYIALVISVPPPTQTATAAITWNNVSSFNAPAFNTHVASLTTNISGGPVWLQSLRFTLSGSVDPNEVRNLRARVNGTFPGFTASTLASDRSVTFNFGSGVQLHNGLHFIDLFTDVNVGSGRTLQFTIIPNDIMLVTSNNARVTASISGTPSFINIGPGAPAPLSASLNSSFGAPIYATGITNARVASFFLNAGGSEDIRVTSLSFDKDSDTNALDIQNVRVTVNGGQFGSIHSNVPDNGASLVFTGSSITIPRNSSATVDVYADIINTTTTGSFTSLIDLTGWNAVNVSSNTTILQPGSVEGQSVVISSAIQLSLGVGSGPATGQIITSSQDHVLARFTIMGSAQDDIRVSQITITDTITGNSANQNEASLRDLELWVDGTRIAGPVNPSVNTFTTSTSTARATFTLSPLLVIPRNQTKTIEVRGDVAASGTAVSGSMHRLSIQSNSDVSAFGSTSNIVASVSGAPVTSNVQTITRSSLTLAVSALGNTNNRSRGTTDDVAQLSLTAQSAGSVTVNTITLSFSGTAIASTTSAFGVRLVDTSGNNWGGSSEQVCAPPATSTSTVCAVTFTPTAQIIAGATTQLRVRLVNSTGLANQSNTDQLLIRLIEKDDLVWTDGVSTFDLGAINVTTPFTIATINYE